MLQPGQAHMEPTPSQRFGKAMQDYFQAEKSGALFIMAWGILGRLTGGYFFSEMGTPLYKGVAYPVVAIGLIHMLVGGTVFFRTGKQLAELMEGLRLFPKEMVAAEKSRMAQVMSNFERYKTVEMLLFFLGFSFVLGGSFGGVGQFMLGTGVGLCLQGGVTLIFDLFAAYRGGFYQHELDKFERAMR